MWEGETWLLLSFQKLRNKYKLGETCVLTWKIWKVLLVDRQTGKNYALSLVLRKFIYENIKSIF